jgi:excisionase family DNA binding protein
VPDEFLTVPEVAQLLKVADKPVHAMTQHGEIPAFTVWGQWRIRRTDIGSWIDAQTIWPRPKNSKQEGRDGSK